MTLKSCFPIIVAFLPYLFSAFLIAVLFVCFITLLLKVQYPIDEWLEYIYRYDEKNPNPTALMRLHNGKGYKEIVGVLFFFFVCKYEFHFCEDLKVTFFAQHSELHFVKQNLPSLLSFSLISIWNTECTLITSKLFWGTTRGLYHSSVSPFAVGIMVVLEQIQEEEELSAMCCETEGLWAVLTPCRKHCLLWLQSSKAAKLIIM